MGAAMRTRRARTWVRLTSVLLVAGLVAAACGDDDEAGSTAEGGAAEGATTTVAAASSGAASGGGTVDGDLEVLIAAAQAEGQVNLIALPDTWANYRGILDAFIETYGIDAPVANPDASSADEITAVNTLRGQPDMPCAFDVGPSFTTQLVEEDLVEPYKPTTWDEIPDSLKDPDGNWVGAYYGVMAFGVNTTIIDEVPRTWEDLKDPAYANAVAINGDPREAGAAFAAVMAAAVANGGSFDDIMPGIEFYAELKELGNLVAVDVSEATLISGEVPIALDWTYNFPGLVPVLEENGIEMEVVVPEDGVYGSYYAQAAVKDCPQPNAAKLWIEHIVSDAGALGYLEGGAIPARYGALVAAGLVSEELAANLPSQEVIEQIEFPSQEQIDAAKSVLQENWGPMVADS